MSLTIEIGTALAETLQYCTFYLSLALAVFGLSVACLVGGSK